MDNLAHTLAGLALAETGLRRRTALGATTLAIGANLPDVDALIYLVGDGVDALAFRRGWTHGILAMALLPLLLAGAVLLWDQVVRRRSGRPPVDARWLLALAAIGVWSHPLLDLLNTYGVRLLMPFSQRWFYGDALFIIDPWLWLALLIGIVVARRWRTERPARIAVTAVAAYAIVMAVSARAAAAVVEERARTGPAHRVMVGPQPLDPFRRLVVRDLGDRYETGILRLVPSTQYTPDSVTPSGIGEPLALAAARTDDGAAFLRWARFPRYIIEAVGDSASVRILDMRYTDARGRGWAAVAVRVPR